MTLFRRIACLAAFCLLSACGRPDCPPVAGPDLSIYEPCLARGEYIKGARQIGPFTVLDVEAGGIFGSSGRFERLLHRGRVVVDQTHRVHRWEDRQEILLFANFYDTANPNDGNLHLVYEQAGRPVVEQIPQTGFYANEAYPYGMPISPQLRYFSNGESFDDAGFLLQALPTRRTMLPPGLEGHRSPAAQELAGIAPDGKAFAYTDSVTEPSLILVVDADGTIREPVPIPIPPALSAGQDKPHPYKPLWAWFDKTFRWTRDPRGHWTLAPAWKRGPSGTALPLEMLFLDAPRGYRDCLAADTPGCAGGWRLRKDDENAERCCAERYTYLPTAPAQAFGAPVLALAIGRTANWSAAYHVRLDAPASALVAAMERRLRAQGVRFIRLDLCLAEDGGDDACRDRMNKLAPLKDPDAHSLQTRLLSSAEEQPVFVTPGAAFALYSDKTGGTWLTTLLRYPLPLP